MQNVFTSPLLKVFAVALCLLSGPGNAQEAKCVTPEQLDQFRMRVQEISEGHLALLPKTLAASKRQMIALEAHRECRAQTIWCIKTAREVELAKEESALISQALATSEQAVAAALNIYKLAESARCQ